jgi:cytochrome P450
VRVAPDEVAISDISAVKQIHKVGGPYLKSGFYTHIGHKSYKTIFSTTDAQYHAKRRKLLSGPMSDSNMRQYEPLVASRVHLCMNRMEEEAENRGVIDVFKWWLFQTTDTIGELSFGESFRMLEHGKVIDDL